MKLKKINDKVYYLPGDIISLNRHKILELESIAAQNPRRRARICTHADHHDPFQEMFIVHYKDTYVRPHYHQHKSESFHVVSGEADIVIFGAEGEHLHIIPLGEYNNGKSFYYRIAPNTTHSLIIRTDIFIFHESAKGPFSPLNTSFPNWSPPETNERECKKFMEDLITQTSDPTKPS